MQIEIDDRSGFCFGVVRAISQAEAATAAVSGNADGEMAVCKKPLVSLGDIVHNSAEVERLVGLGLEVVPEDADLADLAGRRILIRAHGEPPATYEAAREYGIELVDATCPVVAALQRTVAEAYAQMERVGGKVVIFGKPGHAEVRGLAGCADGQVIVVESEGDLEQVDFARPIYFLAQTTSSLAEFRRLSEEIRRRAEQRDGTGTDGVTIKDTICRQVSGREEHLTEFARRFDVVIFVTGAKSSNGKALFEAVRAANPNSYKIENTSGLNADGESELRKSLAAAVSVGICGATSTPRWLMEQIADEITRQVS